jgi:hypothetical protein
MLKSICFHKYVAKVQENPTQLQNLRFVSHTKEVIPLPNPNLPTSSLDLTEIRFPYKRFRGIMAANFTPVKQDGSINYDQNFYNYYAADLLA